MSTIEFIRDFSELDLAFKEKLSGCKVLDENGNEIEIEPIYQSPDPDLVDMTLPNIVFWRNNIFPDNRRRQVDDIRDNFQYDENGNLVTMDVRRPPEPWSALYTVHFEYQYKEDGVVINQFLRKTFPRDESYLKVKGIVYDVFYVSGVLSGAKYKDFGITQEGKRVFAESITYRVDFLLDIYDRETISVSQKVGVNVSSSTT